MFSALQVSAVPTAALKAYGGLVGSSGIRAVAGSLGLTAYSWGVVRVFVFGEIVRRHFGTVSKFYNSNCQTWKDGK